VLLIISYYTCILLLANGSGERRVEWTHKLISSLRDDWRGHLKHLWMTDCLPYLCEILNGLWLLMHECFSTHHEHVLLLGFYCDVLMSETLNSACNLMTETLNSLWNGTTGILLNTTKLDCWLALFYGLLDCKYVECFFIAVVNFGILSSWLTSLTSQLELVNEPSRAGFLAR
jgi:hypothetical protein